MNVRALEKVGRKLHSDHLSKLPTEPFAALEPIKDPWSCAMALALTAFGKTVMSVRRTLKRPVTLDAEVNLHRDGFGYNRDDSFSLKLDDDTHIQVYGDSDDDALIGELTGGQFDGESLYGQFHEMVDSLPYWRGGAGGRFCGARRPRHLRRWRHRQAQTLAWMTSTGLNRRVARIAKRRMSPTSMVTSSDACGSPSL